MYTEQDYIDAFRTRRLRVFAGIALICAFVVGAALATSYRLEILQMVIAGLGFIICYFIWNMKITPWIRYARFLKELRDGQHRTLDCRYVSLSGETRVVDGVEVRDLIVTVGNKEEDERLFLLDAEKEPEITTPGAEIRVVSYGNYVLDILEA